MALLVFFLKWLQWKYLFADYSLEIYVGILALLFTSLGVWMALQLVNRKATTVIVEKEVYVPVVSREINTAELEKMELSQREYEVLQQLAKGQSNAEIADTLHVSVSTVKTHVSNLFIKMEVKSRAQAMEKAKRLHLT
jgi:ATP/maltotriose-dependent transcriptional regulator MalT